MAGRVFTFVIGRRWDYNYMHGICNRKIKRAFEKEMDDVIQALEVILNHENEKQV